MYFQLSGGSSERMDQFALSTEKKAMIPFTMAYLHSELAANLRETF